MNKEVLHLTVIANTFAHVMMDLLRPCAHCGAKLMVEPSRGRMAASMTTLRTKVSGEDLLTTIDEFEQRIIKPLALASFSTLAESCDGKPLIFFEELSPRVSIKGVGAEESLVCRAGLKFRMGLMEKGELIVQFAYGFSPLPEGKIEIETSELAVA